MWSWFSERLTLLGNLRDGILVIIGGLYAVGYAVWAFNAWINNLGPLPALDFQYFIAGGIPVLYLAAMYLLIKYIRRLKATASEQLGPSATGWRRILRDLLFILAFASLVVLIAWIYLQDNVESFFPEWNTGVLIGSVAVFAVTSYLLPPLQRDGQSEASPGIREVSGSSFRKIWLALANLGAIIGAYLRSYHPIITLLGTIYLYLLLLFFLTVGIALFLLEIYASIPQEFGGARPRCAQIDLMATQLSAQTREAILPESAVEPGTETARSVEVEVFFVGSDVLLVKPVAREQDTEGTTYEIKRDIVEAIAWCG